MSAPRMRLTRARMVALTCAGMLALTACEGDGSGGGTGNGAGTGGGGTDSDGQGEPDGPDDDGQPDPDLLTGVLSAPDAEALVLEDETAHGLSVEASQTFFTSAPVVVVAAEAEQLRAASVGAALGIPVLVDGPHTAAEVNRLDAEIAMALGQVADPGIDLLIPADDAQLASWIGADAPVNVPVQEAAERVAALDPSTPELLVPEDASTTTEDATQTAEPALERDLDELPATAHPEPAASIALLSTGRDVDLATLGTAKAAGAHVLVGPHTDPRATSESVQALAQIAASTVVGLGSDFGDAETLAWRSRTAATGVELPGGGQLALPGKTYVALYGTPVTSALGVLGEQSIEDTITRAQEHAGWYEPLIDHTVIPSLEIIVTVAASDATDDGNYSREFDVEEFRPLIDLAGENGQYVILDLQPGRDDFVTQAKLYEELLRLPHVGLALDPEWRLRPDQVHMQQIGQVSVEEVNEVVTYLADLTQENDLPQKVLVLHMFQRHMIPDVDEVDQSRSEVAVLIHADGQGPPGSKHGTWASLHEYAPSIEFWGWKNFYDEDSPMLTPEQTVDQVDPLPDFISYQ